MGFRFWRRRKSQGHLHDIRDDDELHPTWPKRFSLSELQVATDNFSNKNAVGRLGSQNFYKGRLADGSLVAIERIEQESTYSMETRFQKELNIRGMAVHRNLHRLCGFCITPKERILVYPYMENGTVASCLRDRPLNQPPLSWPIRKRIALGVARGLAYLHEDCDPKIIHCNIKAANVLLDKEFEAIIHDFEFAKLMNHNDDDVDTVVLGTTGHIAPEYFFTGTVSEKTDVFGCGVMLLELVTGQGVYDLCRLTNDDDVMLLDWVKSFLKDKKLERMVDIDLQGNYVEEEAEQLIHLALLCTQNSAMQRPKMSEIIRLLQGDGLIERWEEMVTRPCHPSTDWVIDSPSDIYSDELTSPRR